MLPEWYTLRTHCEVRGTSQPGKSKFLEYCERRLIKKGQAFYKIDPYARLGKKEKKDATRMV